MELPIETQVKYLLGLNPKDISSYCTSNTEINTICQSDWFWDQKARRDFGYPISIICNQSNYLKYHMVKQLVTEDYSRTYLPVLIHAGEIDLAQKYIKNLDESYAINDAISADDILTLRFLEPYIREYKGPGGMYYTDPYWWFLLNAFTNGSREAVKFLMAMDPEYLNDTIILEEILKPLIKQNQTRGIMLLHPYIEKMVKTYPDILRYEYPVMLSENSVLRQYIEDNFKSLTSPL